MQRFEEVLELLPKGHVFDGELVALDDAGRPQFDALMFGRLRPTYVAFDLLMIDASTCGRCRSGTARRRWRGSAKAPRVGSRSPTAWSGRVRAFPRRGRRGSGRHRGQASGRPVPAEARALAKGSQSGLLAASRARRVVSRARPGRVMLADGRPPGGPSSHRRTALDQRSSRSLPEGQFPP